MHTPAAIESKYCSKTIWTPLHFAVEKGYQEIIELLLANGANINAQDQNGGSSLMLALTKNIRLLQKH